MLSLVPTITIAPADDAVRCLLLVALSPHVSAGEESLLECVVVDECLSVQLDFSLSVNAATEEIVIGYD